MGIKIYTYTNIVWTKCNDIAISHLFIINNITIIIVFSFDRHRFVAPGRYRYHSLRTLIGRCPFVSVIRLKRGVRRVRLVAFSIILLLFILLFIFIIIFRNMLLPFDKKLSVYYCGKMTTTTM